MDQLCIGWVETTYAFLLRSETDWAFILSYYILGKTTLTLMYGEVNEGVVGCSKLDIGGNELVLLESREIDLLSTLCKFVAKTEVCGSFWEDWFFSMTKGALGHMSDTWNCLEEFWNIKPEEKGNSCSLKFILLATKI